MSTELPSGVSGFFHRIICALNDLQQSWIGIVVIVLGMTFDVVSNKFGINTDSATGVIGAGIGLLTSQIIHKANQTSNPQPPVGPAQP